MKTKPISYAGIDQAQDFVQLANDTQGNLKDHNTIRWETGIMRGQVKKWHLDTGLHMRVWDVIFTEPVVLSKQAAPLYIANSNFSLLCILSPDSILLKSVDQHQQFTKMREKNMVMVPDAISAELQITANALVQLIDFQIAPYWLRNKPGFLQLSKYFNESVGEYNSLPVLMEPWVKRDYNTARKLFSDSVSDHSQQPGELLFLSDVLIGDFLEKIAASSAEPANGNIAAYYEKMLEVEGILMASLQSSLPRLGNVAQQVALSESTLKRYFKQIFGKSIYEYYLVKKMEMARKLMIEQPLTVNEAAELMGYEKASNFIDIFKKHHGYSPGAIRKKSIPMQDGNSGTFMA